MCLPIKLLYMKFYLFIIFIISMEILPNTPKQTIGLSEYIKCKLATFRKLVSYITRCLQVILDLNFHCDICEVSQEFCVNVTHKFYVDILVELLLYSLIDVLYIL